jgi:hypothetical protein
MMVGIDQPRQDDMPFEVKDFIGNRWKVACWPDLLDEPIANKKTAIGNFPLVVVHGHNVCVFYEESCHWFQPLGLTFGLLKKAQHKVIV